MVEKIIIAFIVILAFYFIIRFILRKIAGKELKNPCDCCSSCNFKDKNSCNVVIEDRD